MKKVITLFAAIIIAATTIKAQTTQSYIYIFRGGQWGSALSNYAIFVDGQKVCKLSNGKYLKYPVSAGKHDVEAHIGGIGIGKKETFVSVITETGKDNYVSCTIKHSITRSRLEMLEVVENTGKELINKMKEDKCNDD
jgi:hypothetical protein